MIEDYSEADFSEYEAKAQLLNEHYSITQDLKHDTTALIRFVESCGGRWHGLTIETLLHFHFRYIENWINPKIRFDSPTSVTPSPHMIIPSDTSRRANYSAWEEYEHFRKIDNFGLEQTLFNAEALTSDFPIIPVVENPVAAAAIWQATNGTFPAVALASFDIRAAAKGKLLTAIEELKPVNKKFLILLDSDPDGLLLSGNLLVDLFKINIPAVVKYLDVYLDDSEKTICLDTKSRYSGIVNAFSILEAKGDEFLKNLIQRIAENVQNDFSRVEKEIAEKQAEAARVALTDEQRKFLFSDQSVSDKAFAKRMGFFFGNRVRWLKDDSVWATFEGNKYGGGVWTVNGDDNAHIFPLAFDLSERLDANAKLDGEVKIAKAFTSTKKFSTTISMMKSLPSLLIKSEDLDRNPNLLNCVNCVLDLESGRRYEKDLSSLLLSKQTNAVYRGMDFHYEAVDEFLSSIQPNPETRAALLRYLGYATTGVIREHVFQIWRGDGRNGKSSAILLVKSTLGTYAVTVPKTTFLDTGREADPNAATPSLSPLEGARLAICDELPRTARVNAALLKTLSGGDEISIRRLRAEAKIIKPTAKIIINGNFNPSLDDVNDLGLRERIRNMPFSQTFTGDRAKPKLIEQLFTDDARSAMLAILVREAKEWYRSGLLESAEMLNAKKNYIDSNDFVSEFVAENCEYGNGCIELKDFIDSLKDNSDEAKRTPDRLLKDMVRKQLVGNHDVTEGQHPKSRRKCFFGIHWLIAPPPRS